MSDKVHVVWQHYDVTSSDRAAIKGQKPCVIWLTGLSGSGKSTVGGHLDSYLHSQGYHSYILDGDNVRHGLNKDLTFSEEDRIENIRRVGEASRLMADAGLILITAFISPFRADRAMVRELFEPGQFIEVFVNAPLEVCEQRDVKGLYKKARAGEIKDFTGISSPYEAPDAAEIQVNTGDQTVEESVETIIEYLNANGYLKKP